MRYCSQCGRPVADGAPCGYCSRPASRAGAAQAISASRVSPKSGTSNPWLDPESADLLNTTIQVAGRTWRLAFRTAWFIGILLLMMSAFTLTGVLFGKVPIICAAGLVWIGFFYGIFVVADSARTIAECVKGHASGISGWLKALSRPVSENDVMVVADWFLGAVAWCSSKVGSLFFFLMGCTASLIHWLTDLHLSLARHRVEASHSDHGLPWFVNVGFAVIPPLLGVTADWRKQNPLSPEKLGKAVAFIRSFEFLRCLVLLVCGLWGMMAFQAGDRILELPSDDTIAGIPVLLPVKLLSAERRDAAYALYLAQGFYAYTFFFAVLPLGVIVWAEWRKQRQQFLGRETRFAKQNRRAAAILCCGLLLLSMTVAWRSGGVARYTIAAIARFTGEPKDRALSSCLAGASSQGAALQCARKWTADWEAELTDVSKARAAELTPAQRQRFEQQEQNWWRRDVARFYVPGANGPTLPSDRTLNVGIAIRSHVRELRALLDPASH